MAKDKDRALNPAAAQRKLEKQKALKKGKAAVQAQRTERLAHRNPHRLESQVSDLQALKESQGGKLGARDQKQLEELERDVGRVKKAREKVGDKAPGFGGGRGEGGGDRGGRGDAGNGRGRGRGRGGYGGLGKRSRGEEEGQESGEETDESVRRIPMPRDTPPPVPRQNAHRAQQQQQQPREGTNANATPMGAARVRPGSLASEGYRPDLALPPKPETKPVKSVYESAPQVRDLRKEATSRFVPAAVKRKLDAVKGVGGRLLEEEEVRKMEGEGYGAGGGGGGREVDAAPDVDIEVGKGGEGKGGGGEMEGEEARRLREEEERFRREMEMEMEVGGDGDVDGKDEEGEAGGRGTRRGVQVEEVEDEDL